MSAVKSQPRAVRYKRYWCDHVCLLPSNIAMLAKCLGQRKPVPKVASMASTVDILLLGSGMPAPF